MVGHVLGAEVGYAATLGLRLNLQAYDDKPALSTFRNTVVERLQSAVGPAQPPAKGRWPVRYAARRIAWHVLDHAWEIEDKSGPGPASRR